MQIFGSCLVVLEVKDLPFKEKKKLKLAITDNGGHIAYVVNKQCTHVITTNPAKVSANRKRNIQKFQIPVVGVEYVSRCLEKGALLSAEEHCLVTKPPSKTDTSSSPSSQALGFKMTGQTPLGQGSGDKPKPQTSPAPQQEEKVVEEKGGKKDGEARIGTSQGSHRGLSEKDRDLPIFPSNFEVAKYSIFERVSPRNCSVLELQSCRGQTGREYRVVRYWSEGEGTQATVTCDKQVHCPSSEEAIQVYEKLEKELEAQDFKVRPTLPPQPQELGSSKLHELLLEEKMNTSALSKEVGVFVELLWREALGCLDNILKTPLNRISLNDVSRAEGLLLQAHRALKQGGDQEQLRLLTLELDSLLPPRQASALSLPTVSQKLDLCQLIRDMLQVSEATRWDPFASCLGKYRALRCSIDLVPAGSSEFQLIGGWLQHRNVQVLQLFRVNRAAELQAFRADLGNVRPLLHSSAARNFVGILSRGLLLPRVGVEHHGIERTDIGNLGSGIYFSDSLRPCLKYSKPSTTDGSHLLLVCDVALGKCQALRKKDPSLSSAPEGYHSVHGVRIIRGAISDFADDEYVVYQTDQVRVKYVVRFRWEDEPVKEFQPPVDLLSDVVERASPSDVLAKGEEDGIGGYKKRLEDVTAGLLDNTGQPLPLQAVHVKCKLMDLLTQVIIFQSYTNQSRVPIEAKYVFPLDESAAVCGFEAFINGKHIVGQVKEKEQARREYRQAIEKGHGAYLMDQDAPDVFTISVGNLPPGATVLIKITYITELVVRAGQLLFSLPGSVAPWQESKALNQTTQVSVEKVCVNELKDDRIFTLDMSIQMPYEILDLSCVTHLIKMKRTDCAAVVSTLPGQTLGPGGFQLSFSLSQMHLPRMWVENHPEKDSQACMLVFYPHFDTGAEDGDGGGEVVVLLDTSESMRGAALKDGRRIAVQLLKTLDPEVRINVIAFAATHKELFLSSQAYSKALEPATRFAMSSPPVGGSTELWRPLRSLSLLPPSRGIRNLLLISDGHIQNEGLTLQLVREGIQHTRVFTCGVSPTANRHMLRALAQAGGGAYEFFDTKTKHSWAEKVSSQARRMAGPGCSSVSVKWQQFTGPDAPPPLQAPAQLNALFSDCHTLVYGFVPHCTQATLFGKLKEQELETVVSTSELQKTRGTLLHKLTARAVIRDYEDGSLHANEAEHEGKKEELKSFIIELSKEYSIVTQYTSFVAIEERDVERPDVGVTNILKLIAEEDVDILSYMGWEEEVEYIPFSLLSVEKNQEEEDEDEEMWLGCGWLGQSDEAEEAEEDAEEDKMEYDVMEETEEEDVERLDVGVTNIPKLIAEEDVDILSYMGWEEEEEYIPCGLLSVEKKKEEEDEDEEDEEMGYGWLGQSDEAEEEEEDAEEDKMEYDVVEGTEEEGVKGLVKLSSVIIDSASGLQSRLKRQKSIDHSVKSAAAPVPTGHTLFEEYSLHSSARSFAQTRLHDSRHPEKEKNKKKKYEFPSICSMVGAPLRPGRERLLPRDESYIPACFMPFGSSSAAPPPPPPPPPSAAPPPSAPIPPPGMGDELMACATLHLPDFKLIPAGSPPGPSTDRRTLSSHSAPLPYVPLPHKVLASDSAQPARQIRERKKMIKVSAILRAEPGAFGDSPPALLPHPTRPPPASLANKVLQLQQQRSFRREAVASDLSTDATPVPGGEWRSSTGRAFARSFALKRSIPSPRQREKESILMAESLEATLSDSSTDSSVCSTDGLDAERFLARDTAESWTARSPSRGFSYEHASLSTSLRDGASEEFIEGIEKTTTRSPTSGLTYCLGAKDSPLRPSSAVLFDLQHQDGYWECSEKLGSILGLDLMFFANVFLKEKGITSLGMRAEADILKMVATLLVLQLMRIMGLGEGKLLKTLLRLKDSSTPTSLRGQAVKRAVDWVSRADRQYPSVYSRLEFGRDWESATRQLLGADPLPTHSPLRPVLERTSGIPERASVPYPVSLLQNPLNLQFLH